MTLTKEQHIARIHDEFTALTRNEPWSRTLLDVVESGALPYTVALELGITELVKENERLRKRLEDQIIFGTMITIKVPPNDR